jgi:hypothetical protein
MGSSRHGPRPDSLSGVSRISSRSSLSSSLDAHPTDILAAPPLFRSRLALVRALRSIQDTMGWTQNWAAMRWVGVVGTLFVESAVLVYLEGDHAIKLLEATALLFSGATLTLFLLNALLDHQKTPSTGPPAHSRVPPHTSAVLVDGDECLQVDLVLAPTSATLGRSQRSCHLSSACVRERAPTSMVIRLTLTHIDPVSQAPLLPIVEPLGLIQHSLKVFACGWLQQHVSSTSLLEAVHCGRHSVGSASNHVGCRHGSLDGVCGLAIALQRLEERESTHRHVLVQQNEPNTA